MRYLFYQFNGKDTELEGLVHVEPGEQEDSAKIVEIIPPSFTDYINSLDGKEYGLLLAAGIKDPMNLKLMSHWHLLTNIFNINNGYGGVEEYTDDEFMELAKELGFEEEAEGETD